MGGHADRCAQMCVTRSVRQNPGTVSAHTHPPDIPARTVQPAGCCASLHTCSSGSWPGHSASPFLPIPPSASCVGLGLFQHAHLQLLDHSLYEEGAELHALQALLGQADGVEDSSSDPVLLLCFRRRALFHNALQTPTATSERLVCTAHMRATRPHSQDKTHGTKALQENLVPAPTLWWPRFRPSVLKVEVSTTLPACHWETAAVSHCSASSLCRHHGDTLLCVH